MNIDYFFISKPRCASTHIYEGLTKWNDEIDGNKKYYHYTSTSQKFLSDLYKCFHHKYCHPLFRFYSN